MFLIGYVSGRYFLAVAGTKVEGPSLRASPFFCRANNVLFHMKPGAKSDGRVKVVEAVTLTDKVVCKPSPVTSATISSITMISRCITRRIKV